MAKELFISTTPHETKVAVVEDEQLAEIYFERENEYTLAGSIYKGRVTRVLPGMQSAFVDIGLERDAFLYVTDFLEEQEDQEEFEQVVNRAHTDAHQPGRQLNVATPSEEGEEGAAAEGAPADGGSRDLQGAAQPSERGPRRWRGRRGRRRGRGGFDDQPRTAGEPHGSESPIAGAETAGEHEPAILPGESLSKYRSPESETHDQHVHEERSTRERHTEAPQSQVSEPAPEQGAFRQSPAESGGSFAVLPGESISKYRRGEQPEASQSGTQAPPTPEPPQARRESRWERPNRRPGRDRPERDRPERERWQAPTGPAVFTLPGESVAKYRHGESAESVVTSPEVRPTEIVAAPEVSEPTAAIEEHRSAEVHGQQTANIQYSEPAQTDPPERVEHALQDPEPVRQTQYAAHPPATRESAVEAVGALVEADTDEAEELSGEHQYGAGVIEEEVIDEEESDALPLGEHLDEEIFEELEEETIDAENGEQFIEAVREAHVIQRLGLREGEPPDLEDHPAGEEVDSFVAENGHGETELEASQAEDEQSDGDHEGDEQDEQEEGTEEEGRAELRAPANTAGFQQRTERTDRNVPDRFRRGGRRGRPPMRGRRNIQRESQPTISDLLKEGQEILVQIAKEPIAKKGARITSHIALPGRFLVYMPTVNHVGVSRKIGSDEERQRLKRVLISEKGSAHGGFIVRTAASGASEEDLRSDLRFLINLWNDIKSRSENSKAPALIYHDLNLVERILRDQVTSNFAGIWVDSEQEYERIVRFLGRFQPAMVRRAKLYTKDTPLFEQFGIQEEINNALKSKVWLKSGGYIVINQTEALVAIDINTGKYVGKTTRLEDTIVKTNIDAIREIVRQIRLRDLGGIIVIDFIDMDERKNRQKVMIALEEALKSDRAPSKVLQFNDFGLVAITRKRVKQSLERTLSTPCVYCTGTGMIKSVQTVCNEIYVEMRKMSKNLERHDVMLRVNPEVVKALKVNGARWLQEMEDLTGKTIIVKSDPLLHQEQFDIN